MYDNIGRKIKLLAKFLFGLEAAISMVSAVYYIFEGITENITGLFWLGLLILFIGPLCAWISTWLLYGFGELIESNENLSNAVENELVPSIQALHSTIANISFNQTYFKAQNSNSIESKKDNEKFVSSFVVDTSIADTLD